MIRGLVTIKSMAGFYLGAGLFCQEIPLHMEYQNCLGGGGGGREGVNRTSTSTSIPNKYCIMY